MGRMSALHDGGGFTAARAIEPDVQTTGTKNGVGIDLQGLRGCIFNFSPGTLGSSATMDGYLQDSPDNSAWTNVSGKTITQITVSDGDGEVLGYGSGANRWVRAVMVIGVATSDAGVTAQTY